MTFLVIAGKKFAGDEAPPYNQGVATAVPWPVPWMGNLTHCQYALSVTRIEILNLKIEVSRVFASWTKTTCRPNLWAASRLARGIRIRHNCWCGHYPNLCKESVSDVNGQDVVPEWGHGPVTGGPICVHFLACPTAEFFLKHAISRATRPLGLSFTNQFSSPQPDLFFSRHNRLLANNTVGDTKMPRKKRSGRWFNISTDVRGIFWLNHNPLCRISTRKPVENDSEFQLFWLRVWKWTVENIKCHLTLD